VTWIATMIALVARLVWTLACAAVALLALGVLWVILSATLLR
jgi:hypothetical protein